MLLTEANRNEKKKQADYNINSSRYEYKNQSFFIHIFVAARQIYSKVFIVAKLPVPEI